MGTTCPMCDRFVGNQDECPYCSCDTLTPRILKQMRFASIILALAGTCFLGLMSITHEPQLVRAGRITPMMNHARVRVAGIVDGNTFLSKKQGQTDYLSFYLNDGTGSIRAAAYSATAGIITSSGRLPAKGDEVEITGSLRITAGKPITLQLEKSGIQWKP